MMKEVREWYEMAAVDLGVAKYLDAWMQLIIQSH